MERFVGVTDGGELKGITVGKATIEKYGSGIYLENELCLKNGNKKPVYEITPNQTKVIFKSQVEDVTVVELDETVLSQLNKRQKQFVVI